MSSPLWDGVREGCGSCEFAMHRQGTQYTNHQGNVITPEWFVCRRYPPVVLQVTSENRNAGGHNYEIEQHQPSMDKTDWCGEWKRKS